MIRPGIRVVVGGTSTVSGSRRIIPNARARARARVFVLVRVRADWKDRTREECMLCWVGSEQRKSKIYLAAFVVDHTQLDKFAAGGMSWCDACILW